jgi:hypothetical protein
VGIFSATATPRSNCWYGRPGTSMKWQHDPVEGSIIMRTWAT